MDEIKLGQQQSKGAQAEALLNSPLFQEVFAKLEAGYLKAWRDETRTKDGDAREKIWIAVHVLSKVKDHLRQLISDGKVASRDMAMLSAEYERKQSKKR